MQDEESHNAGVSALCLLTDSGQGDSAKTKAEAVEGHQLSKQSDHGRRCLYQEWESSWCAYE
jgi:hypothetical protein